MIVASGPWTLCTTMGLSIVTRLVSSDPEAVRPPVAYVPLLTHTVSPADAASTPVWIVCLAVAQLVPAAASLPLVATNHSAAPAGAAPAATSIPTRTHARVFNGAHSGSD